jgi:3-oxoacyl-(acyl-carrier-protein) synthase
MALSRRDVVISRIGLVTGAGVGSAPAWDALRAEKREPSAIRVFPAGLLDGAFGFEVPGWSPDAISKDRRLAYYTRAAQFALKASIECLDGLSAGERDRLGVVVGTRYSTVNNGLQLLEEPGFMTPIKFLSTLPSSTPTNVSLFLGLHGITTSVSSSWAGAEALCCARDLVASGQLAAVLAGGAEELSPEVYAGCQLAGVLAGALGEGGLVPGEAAAMVLLESAAHAAAAGRAAFATLAGTGAAHAPRPGLAAAVDAGRRALLAALTDAGAAPGDVDAVFLGANGQAEQDEISRGAIAAVFGGAPPALVAPKAWLGETFGAAGAVAAAAAALSLRDGVLPGGARPARCRTVLVHDYGCDGGHAGLVLRHPDPKPATERGA